VPRPSSLVRSLVLLLPLVLAACDPEPVAVTPIPVGGTSDAPREVNLIAKDYTFVPPVLDLVPGETVMLHIVNGGLDVHEAVIGDDAAQGAWESAEAAAAVGLPPGATPKVSVDPSVGGLRIVVGSGQRVDMVWTVPSAMPAGGLVVGCHIPGHWAKGMVVPIRFVQPGSVP